jgi:acetyl-CoA carboxylase biotin carboxylase subunit
MFKKILIANRGEIAVRVIRACREMNIASVAVYSDSDQEALHVRLADQAVPIGPPAPQQSYLAIEKLLSAALQTGVDAVHPGYGFLSENADFAQAVQEAGLSFIGPAPQTIRAMGSKAEARRRMQEAGVQVIPGYQGIDSDQALLAAAHEIGWPVLVKAAAGGGGKGMRVVWEADKFAEAIAGARREALHAFGNGQLILERYIAGAHHIEFQVLGDQHGNLVHLFERECSIQRRHQKIIEETPSTLLDGALREQMGQAALTAARAVGYQNAGTIEFILDPAKHSFYFLEMNTRLQVEHPITELVTGIDLVQWQIRIAAGERLTFEQQDLRQRGHAIECRLYAEDPANQFLPASGLLLRFIEPKGPGVRVDSGFTSGAEISIHYDPLIAKIIASAENRAGAIQKMQATLHETVLLGIPSNWQFLQDVLAHPDFQSGHAFTTWIEENFDGWLPSQCQTPDEVLLAAALAHYQQLAQPPDAHPVSEHDPFSPWRVTNSFRLGEG